MMRKTLCLTILFSMLSASRLYSQDTLSVVNWNIEWFGSLQNGPSNKNVQEQNVLKILRYLNADLYGLCEVVDTIRLKRVVDSLGSDYAFVVSSFASGAPSFNSPNWTSAQKLAFIYRKSVFSNIAARAMLNNGSSAYYNFASGRLPYLFNANVSKGGKKRNIHFIMIHAKAGASASDFIRRKDGARELKDSLDPFYSGRPAIIMGDYNDELEGSIVSGYSTSPYDVMVKDSIQSNANYYRSVSLPLERAGMRSTITYTNVIDHQVINKRMDSMYVPFSAAIRTDIINAVPDFLSHNTTDHYPVFSRYKLIAGDTTAVVVNPPPPPPPANPFVGFKVWPNPFENTITYRSGKNLTNVEMVLFNATGKKVWQQKTGNITTQLFYEFTLPILPRGVYVLKIVSREENYQYKLLRK